MTNFNDATHPGWNDQQAYPTLTVGCAVCLLSRIHPVIGQRMGFDALPEDTVSKGYRLTYAISLGKIRTEKLYVSRDGQNGVEVAQYLPGDEIDWRTLLRADDFAEWCEENQLEHPWSTSKKPDSCAPEGTLLETRERETLLSLIGVLAELAGIDLRAETKGHSEAASIKAELEVRNVKIGSRTVADKLVAARMLIAPKGPGRVTGRK